MTGLEPATSPLPEEVAPDCAPGGKSSLAEHRPREVFESDALPLSYRREDRLGVEPRLSGSPCVVEKYPHASHQREVHCVVVSPSVRLATREQYQGRVTLYTAFFKIFSADGCAPTEWPGRSALLLAQESIITHAQCACTRLEVKRPISGDYRSARRRCLSRHARSCRPTRSACSVSCRRTWSQSQQRRR